MADRVTTTSTAKPPAPADKHNPAKPFDARTATEEEFRRAEFILKVNDPTSKEGRSIAAVIHNPHSRNRQP